MSFSVLLPFREIPHCQSDSPTTLAAFFRVVKTPGSAGFFTDPGVDLLLFYLVAL